MKLVNLQTYLKPYRINLFIIRNRAQITVLQEDKLLEVEMLHPKVENLCWLHKVAPGFPINGSKVKLMILYTYIHIFGLKYILSYIIGVIL